MAHLEKLKEQIIGAWKECKVRAIDIDPCIYTNYENLLRLMYKGGIAGIQFSATEQEIITEQVPAVLFTMDAFISEVTNPFPSGGNYGWSKIERSGLQFLIDQCKQMSSEKVRAALEHFDRMGTILDWDDCFKKVQNFGLCELGVEDFDPPGEDLERIPKSHWWFSRIRRSSLSLENQEETVENDPPAPSGKDCRLFANEESATDRVQMSKPPWSTGQHAREPEQLNKEVIESLKECQFKAIKIDPRIDLNFEKLLRLMYTAGLAGIKFSEEEKEVIAEKMPIVLFTMDAFVAHLTNPFPSGGNYGWSKIERSGLQFLLDLCKEISSEKVQEALKLFYLTGSINEWDFCLKKVERTGILDFGVQDFDPPKEDLERIPNSHWWFSETRERAENVDYREGTDTTACSATPTDRD